MTRAGLQHPLVVDLITREKNGTICLIVADAFDALTSDRPYKPAWTNDEALAWLRGVARARFDQQCVEALAANLERVTQIQARFRDPAPAA